jgi:hypothetical protein
MKKEITEAALYLYDLKMEHPREFDAGISQIVLRDTLDQTNRRGMRTRIVRFEAGAHTSIPFSHEYHEEVYLISGDQTVVDPEQPSQLRTYQAGTYFARPAGTQHGPFSSNSGCFLLEIHYYDSEE